MMKRRWSATAMGVSDMASGRRVKRSDATGEQQALFVAPTPDEHLSIGALETWLGDIIRTFPALNSPGRCRP